MVNSLHLNPAELEVLRELQDGSNYELAFSDPAWDELSDLGLVAARGARSWTLTVRGRFYRTA
jgi:hypothetical protein